MSVLVTSPSGIGADPDPVVEEDVVGDVVEEEVGDGFVTSVPESLELEYENVPLVSSSEDESEEPSVAHRCRMSSISSNGNWK